MLKKFLFIISLSFSLSAFVSGQTPNAANGTNQVENKSSLAYGIVVDNSGSFRTILEEVIDSTEQIIEANNSDDEAFLVRFVDSEKISLKQDFTQSKEELKSEAEDMYIEGGATAILDALDFSAKHLAKKETASGNKRKFLILITDGEERGSVAKFETVVKFLKDEKIQVYTLGLSDGKIYKTFLDKLAKETGGKSFAVEKRSDRQKIVAQLIAAVRAQ